MRRFVSKAGGFAVGLRAFLLVLAAAGCVDASAFLVNPTRITLSAASASAVLTVRNDSDTPLRFQITTTKWGEAPDGEMQLEPTQDLVVFPLLMIIQPKEERRIRVGVGKDKLSVVREETYRVFVEELPDAAGRNNEAGVKVLTRMGIPVFIQPTRPRAAAALEGLSVVGRDISFSVVNQGNVHILPQRVTVRQLGQGDVPLQTEAPSTWYILAGGRRDYKVPVSPASCAAVRTIVVETQIADTVLTDRLPVPAGSCSR